MARLNPSQAFVEIPSGFRSVPIELNAKGSALRLCALVRTEPDPVAGSLLLLRESDDAFIYLGCIADQANHVKGWVEIWVQSPDNLSGSPTGYQERLSNSVLDQRWQEQAAAYAALDPENTLTTSWESTHPTPTLLDATEGNLAPVGKPGEGDHYVLCTDDAVLTAAGLPTYSHSRHRYLIQSNGSDGGKLIPVSSGAPTSDRTEGLSEIVSNFDQLVPFNAHAGLIQVRRLSPIASDAYCDLLSGKPWDGMGYGKNPFPLGPVYNPLQGSTPLEETGGFLFTGPQGLSSRLVETFHLKLHLIAETLRLVQEYVSHQQLPFLNLSPDSFHVQLQRASSGLPYLWTARVALSKPSQALALPIEDGEFRYFLPGKTPHPFIYLPENIGRSINGECTLRIREVKDPGDGRSVVEGTLVSQEKLPVSPHDLIWLNVPLGDSKADLYGHLYEEDGMAQGEYRFRTISMSLREPTRNALNAAAGTGLSRVQFEIVPLLSTPCDLYSLGVLFTRMLLVNEDNTLPIALDEVQSLARQVGTESNAPEELGNKVRSLFDGDSRWLNSIGPQRLQHSSLDPTEAAQLIPMELWHDALAQLIRLFPGTGAQSICKDFGDAPPAAMHSIFNEPLKAIEALAVRSRSLIVHDWTHNREIHNVIKKFASDPDSPST